MSRIHRSIPTLVLIAAVAGAMRAAAQTAPDTLSRAEQVADSLEAPPPAVDPDYLGRDTVWATPGQTYRAGPIKRILFGDLNRDLWELEIPVPVLDLDGVGGGLEVDELGGGLQTLGMRFESRDGRTFQFRSIVKNASRAIPPILRSTPVDGVVEDQMGALFPLSAMVVAELVESAGLLVAKPRLVVMPDDPRLGEYREGFAGRMGWIEERPNEGEGDTPGFAGSTKITGSDELLEELAENPRSYVDARAVLVSRLIDMLVSDWDRHLDQWRWAAFDEGERTRWEPIPRDRDWALARIDGVLPAVARIYSPKYIGISSDAPDPFRLSWSAQEIDRRFLAALDREEFLRVATDVQRHLDDDAIDRAVGVLPASYREAVGERLTRQLRARRDALDRVAAEFYALLARWIDVYGTDRDDILTIDVLPGGAVHVRLASPDEGGVPGFERTMTADETRELRVYLGAGDDAVVAGGTAPLPFDVRVVGGAGDDRYGTAGEGNGVHVYDHEGDDAFAVGDETYVTASPFEGQEEPPVAYLSWNHRDWGHAWVPRPELRYDSDMGLYLGAGVSRYGFGFGRNPYRSRYSVSVLSGFAPDRWIGDVEFERPFGDRGWRARFDLDWATQRPVWYFGIGNETDRLGDKALHRGHRNEASLWLRGIWAPDSTFRASLGPAARLAGPFHGDAPALDTASAYGAARTHQIGVRGEIALDTRDHFELPRRGALLRIGVGAYPAALEIEEPFAVARAEARTYLSAPLPGSPALHLRLVGAQAWGPTPLGERPSLGGSPSLPGYVERRFVGDRSASAAALLRLDLFPFHVFTDMRAGIHGLASVGRVWVEGEDSDRWHPGLGGGVWLHLLALDRTVSLTHARGRDGTSAFHLDLGFPF